MSTNRKKIADTKPANLPPFFMPKQPLTDLPDLGPVNNVPVAGDGDRSNGIEQGSVRVVQLPVEAPQLPAQAPQAPQATDIPSLMNAAMEAHQKNDLAKAEQLYSVVLSMNWAEPEVLRRIGEVCLAQGRHADALPHMLRALALHSYDARTNAQAGVCCSFMGKMEEAEHYYRRAIAISPNFPLARWNNSLLLLWQGDYRQGWQEYRWGTLLGVRPNRHIEPQWSGIQRIHVPPYKESHGTLYVWAEQGFGDGLMFLRFTKGLKEKFGFSRIVLEVQAPLLPLLWDYDREDIDHIVGSQVDGGFVEEFDEHISLAELPRVLGIDVHNLPSAPYLTPPANGQAEGVLSQWRAARKAEGKLLVGVVWKGNPGHVNDKARSVDLARFAELATIPGVQLVPLVPGEKPSFCPDAFDLPSFEATAQVMKHLDLVISVDTAVVHLAGALGVPTWNLIAKSCDWRWHPVPGDSGKAIWYDAVRLYRQAVQGDWDEVFARVRADLEGKVYQDSGTLPPDIPLLGPGDPAWLPGTKEEGGQDK